MTQHIVWDGDERRSALEIDTERFGNIPHGEPGHTGFRCRPCAALSEIPILIESTSGDYWQSLQLRWQEACDVVFRQFDDAVAKHFPEHQPQNCETCPTKPELPKKPLPPFERVK